MRITLRRGFAAAPEVYEQTWPEAFSLYKACAARILAPDALRPNDKPADLPLVAWTAFDVPDAQGLGCRETNQSPEGLWAVSYDFDDTPANVVGDICGRARELSPQGLVHTTWKHGYGPPGTARARLVLPFERPIPIPAFDRVWETVAQRIGALMAEGLDVQTRNPNRLWFLPATRQGAPLPCWLDAWGVE